MGGALRSDHQLSGCQHQLLRRGNRLLEAHLTSQKLDTFRRQGEVVTATAVHRIEYEWVKVGAKRNPAGRPPEWPDTSHAPTVSISQTGANAAINFRSAAPFQVACIGREVAQLESMRLQIGPSQFVSQTLWRDSCNSRTKGSRSGLCVLLDLQPDLFGFRYKQRILSDVAAPHGVHSRFHLLLVGFL